MENENAKKIVFLRNIPSNIIEEAILVLKGGTRINLKPEKTKKQNDLLLKEAEYIINQYMKNMRQYKKWNMNKKVFINIMINTALIVSIGLFIFLIYKI